ncbi:MAG TPA: hypothetical protein VF033_01820 [Steroidobacteraceae bacterium]
MGKCEVCGNEYDKAFTITQGGASHVFDSFECAIHALAPVCAHCECRIVGHGMESDGKFYCCAHCANHAEGMRPAMRDRADAGKTGTLGI